MAGFFEIFFFFFCSIALFSFYRKNGAFFSGLCRLCSPASGWVAPLAARISRRRNLEGEEEANRGPSSADAFLARHM